MEKLGLKQNKIIAITGGIGSGKSAVLDIVKGLGYKAYSCDDFTQKAYLNKSVRRFIKCNFKGALYGFLKRKVDRKVISGYIFGDENLREKFNRVISPVIFNIAYNKALKVKGLSFLEVPLLFENGYNRSFDIVWVIKRDIKERLNAVIKRSNMTEEEFRKRVNSQYDYKDVEGAEIIENDGDLERLKEKIVEKIKEID